MPQFASCCFCKRRFGKCLNCGKCNDLVAGSRQLLLLLAPLWLVHIFCGLQHCGSCRFPFHNYILWSSFSWADHVKWRANANWSTFCVVPTKFMPTSWKSIWVLCVQISCIQIMPNFNQIMHVSAHCQSINMQLTLAAYSAWRTRRMRNPAHAYYAYASGAAAQLKTSWKNVESSKWN